MSKSIFTISVTSLLLLLFRFSLCANDSIQLESLEQNSRKYYRIDIDSSAFFARQILSYDSNVNPEKYGFALNWIGICFMNKGMVDSADLYYQKAIQFGANNNAGSVTDKAYLNRGINYFNQGDFEKATELTFDALHNFEEKGDTLGVAHACYNLGNAFNRLERYKEALAYYKKAQSVYKNIQPQWSLANVYNAMGTVYTSTQKYDSAIHYLNKSVAIKIAGGAEVYCASEYNNLATIYKEQGQQELAKNYYYKSNKAAKSRGNKAVECHSLHNLALLYFNQNNIDSAYFYSELAIKVLNEYSDYEEHVELYQLHANILSEMGKYERAFFYLKLRNKVADSTKNEAVEKEIVKLHKQYEVAQKNKQLAEQKVQILEQSKELLFQLLLILALIAIVIIIAMFFYQHKKTQSLRTKAKVNEEKNRIAMDLHDHVGAELTIVSSKLDSQIFVAKTTSEKNELGTISSQVKRASEILRESIWSIKLESITVNQLENRLAAFYGRLFQNSTTLITFNSNCSNKVLTPQIALTSYRVLQEALTNAYKYAEATKINIQITASGNQFQFSITDNGKGFDKLKLTDTGFGLANMKSRVEALNGQISINSELGKGTQIVWLFF
ncbi:MAG: tetratricopeptide repeat-containing sensor histidine kinase [Salibacteraceae bacterium]